MSEPRIIRVFPRRNKATPCDAMAFVGGPPFRSMLPPADEVHVSVTFTDDLAEAKRLVRSWAGLGMPVRIGGPATGMRGEAFIPGRYLRPGYVITSRGCPNSCWFCTAWKREGQVVREYLIHPGWNLLDDNLLACSEPHQRAVLSMLAQNNKGRRVEFTGGLEAARLKEWHANALFDLKPKQIFFAYDTPDDWEPLRRAAKMLWAAGFTAAAHRIRAYVLIGGPKDTILMARERLRATYVEGIIPHAMLWDGCPAADRPAWKELQAAWARPARAVHGMAP